MSPWVWAHFEAVEPPIRLFAAFGAKAKGLVQCGDCAQFFESAVPDNFHPLVRCTWCGILNRLRIEGFS